MLVIDLVIPFVVYGTIPPRRNLSSKTSQANDDVPCQFENVGLMSVEGLYRYLRTIARMVELQARAIETNGQGQSATTRGSSFDDFKRLGPPYFSGTLDPTKAEAWITKIEKLFYVIDFYDEQKASYVAFMLNKEAGH